MFKKDEYLFEKKLQDLCGISKINSHKVFICIDTWWKNNMDLKN